MAFWLRKLRRYANPLQAGSLAQGFRRRRMEFFDFLVESLPSPITILDVGGTVSYWQVVGRRENQLRIVLLNLLPEKLPGGNISCVVGDARGIPFLANSFDIVFSNSVIEHMGDLEQQRQMAGEVLRVGRRYFVQTPNYWFPFEPHFLFPCFQFLPERLRIYMVSRFDMGQFSKTLNHEVAKAFVRSIRLLTPREFASLFPKGRLYRERYLGLTKSLVAYGGWDW